MDPMIEPHVKALRVAQTALNYRRLRQAEAAAELRRVRSSQRAAGLSRPLPPVSGRR